jgi:large subunit ribosomal protein L10
MSLLYQRETYSKRKTQTLDQLVEDLTSYKIVGVIRIEPMSGQSVQKIRADLRTSGNKFTIAKNTLMRLAIEKAGDKLNNGNALLPYISGNCAFLFSNDNPFKVAQYLENNKVAAPARPSTIATADITIPKMNTGVGPGTFISELQSVGLPTKIERGTIAIPQDTEVLKEGELVSRTLAAILSRLGITPFEVGLKLEVALNDGVLLDHNSLMTDWFNAIAFAHQQAVNLALNADYLTDATAPTIIAKVQRQVLSLAAEIGYVTPDTANAVLGAANAKVLALIRAINAVDPEALPSDISSVASTVAVDTNIATSGGETTDETEEEEEDETDESDMDLGSLFG